MGAGFERECDVVAGFAEDRPENKALVMVDALSRKKMGTIL
jgi:hypothetical protein